MTPVERRAIEGAIRQCTATLERATQALAHLAQLLDTEPSAAPSRAPAAAPEPEAAPLAPAPRPAPLPSATRRWDYMGQQLTCQQLADLAGCSYSAMFMRLRKDTPETCVAMGGADRGRRWRGTAAPSGPRPEPGKPLQDLPKTRSFATVNGTIDKRRIDAAAPAQALPGVKVTIAPKPRERFEIDPASVPSTFGRIGEYAETGSPLERAYGGAR